MNAQQIINDSKQTEFKELFYPILARQKKADENITKILRDLK